jgi:pimeloyl-ACP methyl ester carboxylesterase
MSAAKQFDLPETFSHKGWTIRYLSQCRDTTTPREWVVCVHGTPWSSDVFRPLLETLWNTQRYNILLYDLPGYGQSQVFHSDGPAEPDTSVKAQGEALAALLRHVGLGLGGGDESSRPHVVAHDIAGVISLRAHLLHGCEYRSLCLLDTNCVLPWGDTLYNLVRAHPAVFEQLPANVFEGCLRAVIDSARFTPGGAWTDALARPWLPGSGSEGYDPQKNFVRQISQSDDAHTAELLDARGYEQVRCRVKILWGEADAWIPRGKMEALARMLGGRMKEFVTVPEAGHLLMLDQPEKVIAEVQRWLKWED